MSRVPTHAAPVRITRVTWDQGNYGPPSWQPLLNPAAVTTTLASDPNLRPANPMRGHGSAIPGGGTELPPDQLGPD